MPLISVILSLVILGVVLYLVSQIPMPTVIHNIIYALAVLAVVLWLVHVLLGIGPGINLR